MLGLYDDEMITRLQRGAAEAAAAWGFDQGAEVRLLTVSENATFHVAGADGAQAVLRVHRPGYHTEAEIRSELEWIEALRAEGAVAAPAPLRTAGGERLAFFGEGEDRRAVAAFAFAAGVEPEPGDRLGAAFHGLGATTARLHAHARRWAPPPGFVRKTWDFDAMLGARRLWGDWRAAEGLDAAGLALLERCAETLRDRLAAYGRGSDRFGLVHADLRLANLLVDGDAITVIDFDDCGFSWFVYDFAAAVSFIETEPYVPALAEAWVDGYRAVAELPDADAAAIPMFVTLRRMLLTAWLASHAETPTAQELGRGFVAGTLAIADDWLSRA
ncbi:Ser/Thr protein kinase RdoA involved in Cpx stress response, MazF antagonist [Rubrimonas cliftonensis]|uniref:Ser/Thr protein kinase RdoA involved in Cpx stress response, MazF antagonist n=2 Tax=Rubrimonas cliftonensis TaxID=89524 RepID=A0A1H4FDV2_9RHOB|nr:Ser/Thr protein kinase RdoA involved in Cpx stress response, MazF antagonist [Rubrimonas cliftonensis]